MDACICWELFKTIPQAAFLPKDCFKDFFPHPFPELQTETAEIKPGEREREKDFNRHHLGCKMLQACPGAITFLQVSLPDQQAHLVTGQLAGDGILRL